MVGGQQNEVRSGGNVASQTIVMPKQSSGSLTLSQTYDYDGVNRLHAVNENVIEGATGPGKVVACPRLSRPRLSQPVPRCEKMGDCQKRRHGPARSHGILSIAVDCPHFFVGTAGDASFHAIRDCLFPNPALGHGASE